MSIPTLQDHAISEIDTLASNILSTVRTMQRADPKDRPMMRERLRGFLSEYVTLVMNAAPK